MSFWQLLKRGGAKAEPPLDPEMGAKKRPRKESSELEGADTSSLDNTQHHLDDATGPTPSSLRAGMRPKRVRNESFKLGEGVGTPKKTTRLPKPSAKRQKKRHVQSSEELVATQFTGYVACDNDGSTGNSAAEAGVVDTASSLGDADESEADQDSDAGGLLEALRIEWPKLDAKATKASPSAKNRRKSSLAAHGTGSAVDDDWISVCSRQTHTDGEKGPKAKRQPSSLIGPSNMAPVKFRIEPKEKWNGLRKYKSITQQSGVRICKKDIVLVKAGPHTLQSPHKLLKHFYVARILDIRAPRVDGGDSIVLLVQWLYLPEELPKRRKPYHGVDELIPSTALDLICPESIEGRVSLYHFDFDGVHSFVEEEQGGAEFGEDWAKKETDDDGAEFRFYWRQFYYARTETSSPVKKFCKCKQPCNPGQGMVYCKKCENWLHDTCVENSAVAAMMKGGLPGVTAKVERDGEETIVRISAKVTCLCCGEMIV